MLNIKFDKAYEQDMVEDLIDEYPDYLNMAIEELEKEAKNYTQSHKHYMEKFVI
jgi:hypothetical protein